MNKRSNCHAIGKCGVRRHAAREHLHNESGRIACPVWYAGIYMLGVGGTGFMPKRIVRRAHCTGLVRAGEQCTRMRPLLGDIHSGH